MQSNDIWYHLYPLGFLGAEDRNPAPGAAGGAVTHRLPDLLDWLDYFADLGVTALLLGPVFESETHGYDIVDPFRVDRRLGDEGDLTRVIDACHDRSLRVGLDVVFNHVGRKHPYFDDVVAKKRESAHSDWFFIDFDRSGYDGFQYETFEGIGQLAKLNHANEQVLDWAVEVARHWMRCGVDAFRLDAAYAISPRFLASLSDRLSAEGLDPFLIGEVIHGDYIATVEAARLDSVTQYELWKAIWSALNDRNFYELAHALERHARYCEKFQPWNFVGNHDTTRIATKLTDQRHVAQSLAVLFSLPGIATIYAGDEQGVEGTKYDREGGDAEIRQPLPSGPADLADSSSSVWKLHQELIALRRARPWLSQGKLSVTQLSNRLITLEVRSQDKLLVVGLNTDDQSAACDIPTGVAPIAGDALSEAGAKLPPHGWGIWSSE